MYIFLVKQLTERLEKNFADHKDFIMQLEKETIITLAPTICATEEVYRYMTEQHDFDEDEIDYLLLFQNPLQIVTEIFLNNGNDMNADSDERICDALQEFFDDSDSDEKYLLMYELDEQETTNNDCKVDDSATGALFSNIIEKLEKLFTIVCCNNCDERMGCKKH